MNMSKVDLTIRSLRMTSRSATAIESNPGPDGQVVYDKINGTLRISIGNGGSNILATQSWTQQNYGSGISAFGRTLVDDNNASAARATLELGTAATAASSDFVASVGSSTVTGNIIVSANTSANALRITQTGSGNALVVEDSANPDSSPFVVDANGVVGIGETAPSSFASAGMVLRSSTASTPAIFNWNTTNDTSTSSFGFRKDRAGAVVQSGDLLGLLRWQGFDSGSYRTAAQVTGEVDGTPGTNDMPGRLVFSTTADGAASPTERMRITNAGNVGIGTANPTARLTVVDSTSQDAVRITQTGTGNALVVEDATNPDATPFVVDASGQLTVGSTTRSTLGSVTPNVLVQNNTSGTANGIGVASWLASTAGSKLALGKSRSATIGTNSVVLSGDALATISFSGDDGAAFVDAASITAAVDGTPGTNDMPGRLVFSTTADGASSPTERMRITNAGNVGIGTTNATSRLTVTGTESSVELYQNVASIRFSSSPNRTNNYYLGANISDGVDAGFIIGQGADIATGTARITINSSGNVGIGGSPGTDSRLRIEGTESRLRSSNTTSGAIAYFGAMSPNEARAWSVTSTPLTFGTSDTERMRIDSAGNVGIGTTSPAATLNVVANTASDAVRITQTGAGNALVVEDETSPDASPFVVGATGNVGIGTTNPGTLLDVSGTGFVRNTRFNATAAYVQRRANGTSSAPTAVSNNDGQFIRFDFYDGASYLPGATIFAEVDGTPGTNDMPGRLMFSTTADGASSPTERMRITNAGNVGIGTASPGYRLTSYVNSSAADVDVAQVVSDATPTGTSITHLRLEKGGGFGGSIGGYIAQGVGSGLVFSTLNGGTRTNQMWITNAGNVGIGTSAPNATLDVARPATAATINITSGANALQLVESTAGDASFINYAAGRSITISQAGTGFVNIGTNSVERMRIDASGNVGIGTSAPSGRLGVSSNRAAHPYSQSWDIFNGATFENSIILGFDGSSSYFGNFQSNPITLRTNNTERMRIDAAGNVGIGAVPITNNGILQLGGHASVHALIEKATITAVAAGSTVNFDAATQAVLYYTSNASSNWTLNIRGSSGLTLNDMMQTGQSLTVAFLATTGNPAFYATGLQIDGSSVTPRWAGGTAPTSGNVSSIDVYTYTVIKTGNAAFIVLAGRDRFA